MSDTEGSGPARGGLVGATIAGRYRVERLIGGGGMASVYEARHIAIERPIAIKVLHPHLADDGVALARFEREARAMASLEHPHIVEIIDMGVSRDRAPYIVMELVRGTSLSLVIEREAPVDVARASRIAGQILDALSAVHARGIVHRDLKPENVVLASDRGPAEFVKVLDFGVAVFSESTRGLTPDGRAMGTPHYASPEQVRGERTIDARADLYSVGAMLFEMLTRYRPFEEKNLVDLSRAILSADPAPMRAFRKDVPERLEQIVRRALAKDPGRRFPDASAMWAALVPFGAEPPPIPAAMPMAVITARAEPNKSDLSASGTRAIDATRGEVLVAARAYLEEALGAEKTASVLDDVPGELRGHMRADLDRAGWFPADAMLALEVADARAGQGDGRLLQGFGRYLARTGSFADFPRGTIPPELFFSSIPDLWPRYFVSGTMRVLRLSRGHGTAEVRGHPRARLGRSLAIVGFLEEALQRTGARDVVVKLVRSTALGDDSDVFDATWT